MIEISNELFCSRTYYCDAAISNGCEELNCGECHRKFPTLGKFIDEYSEEWKGAVYSHCTNDDCDDKECKYREWGDGEEYACLGDDHLTVCACTPFGKPPDGWRPE